MSPRRVTRQFAALTLAVSTCIAAPAIAQAEPAPAPMPDISEFAASLQDGLLPGGIPAAAAASIAPALIGAAAQTEVGDRSGVIVELARNLLHDADTPRQFIAPLQSVIEFFAGGNHQAADDGGPGVPDNVPVISNFIWPTMSFGCIDGGNSVGTAVSIPGPAILPPPGVPAGQTGFVFTALGTPGLAPDQPTHMNVQWLNVLTGRTGFTTLDGGAAINPAGPSTVSGVADTGSGPVIAVASGSITTNANRRCDFLPTLGFVMVP